MCQLMGGVGGGAREGRRGRGARREVGSWAKVPEVEVVVRREALGQVEAGHARRGRGLQRGDAIVPRGTAHPALW